MADLKNKLPLDNENLTEEEIFRYLYHSVSEADRKVLEDKISSDPFDADAVEGLSALNNEEAVQNHVTQLHLNLRQVTARKPRREKEKIKIFEWTILAILILIFLCVISYLVIYMQNRSY